MKKIYIFKIVLFCILLCAGTLSTVIGQNQTVSDRENRELVNRPAWKVHKILKGTYQKKYEKFINDHFAKRDQWVSLATRMQTAMGKKEINGVYFGKDHYLLEKYQKSDFDFEQVNENVEILSDFLDQAVDEYGTEHVTCMMVPSKTTTLSQNLPKYASQYDPQKILKKLRKKTEASETILDLTQEMKEHKDEYIYYRTDHHWTTLGAYYAYHKWAEERGQATAYSREHYQRETVYQDFYGTTYNKVLAGGRKDQVELFHNEGDRSVHVSMDDGDVTADTMYFPEAAEQGFNRYQIFFSKNTFQVDVTTRKKKGRTLLLIKDSFANCFVPFLTEDYDRVIMIDYRYGKRSMGSILDEYEDITDVLVLFNVEKFMQNTKLGKMADFRRQKSKDEEMEEFRMEDFL